MFANNSSGNRQGGHEHQRPDTGSSDEVDEQHNAALPDYLRLAYERIERTDDLLAGIERVLVAARRPRA